MVTGTVIFRLLETISGITGLFLNVKGGLKNSFLVTDYDSDDDYGSNLTRKVRYKHRKEFLFFEDKQMGEVS